jgi:hypothetical protein
MSANDREFGMRPEFVPSPIMVAVAHEAAAWREFYAARGEGEVAVARAAVTVAVAALEGARAAGRVVMAAA